MSTNIRFKAIRKIQVVETGQIEEQTEFFDAWQTPTIITHQINTHENPIQAYKDWVMSGSPDLVEDIFAEDDIFCEGLTIGKRTFNYGTEHCNDFDGWVKNVSKRGFKIIAYSR